MRAFSLALDSPRVTHAPSPQLSFAPPAHEKFVAEALALAESTSAPRAPRAWRPPQLQLPPSNSELTTTAMSAAVVASGGGGRRPRQQRTDADYHALLTSAGLQVRVKRTGGGYCDQPYTADELLERAAQLGDEVQRLTAERDEYGTTLRDERAARAEAELAMAIQQGACLKPGKARLLAKRLADLALNLAPISPPPPTAGPWGGFAGASQAVVPMGLPVLLHAHAPALSPPAMVTAMELGLADPALQLEALDWRRLAQAYERAETLRETREILIEHSISKQV